VTDLVASLQSQGGALTTTPRTSAEIVSDPSVTPVAPELGRLYEEEVDFVWKRMRRLGVDARDLEDKVHDVFVIVQRRLPDHDPVRPVRPWLAGISVRVALDYHRDADRRRLLLVEKERVDPGKGPDRLLEEKQARDLVLAALAALPLEQRTVFVLKELDGFSMPEIEEIVNAPLNTLYSRLRLARERFSSAVRELRAREKHHE
jgi:RNA polymerase sigma-70 factor, ECF subfamily